jgi:hypothetical protein
VFGKGGKTRIIVPPASIWRELNELWGEALGRLARGGEWRARSLPLTLLAASAAASVPDAHATTAP